jgi:RNA polymerase sigma-70 factor, ECF subfamily
MSSPAPALVASSAMPEGAQPEFVTLFREHCDFVWRVLRTLGVAPDALDDALQEVFLVVHRRLPEFEGRSALNTWIYAIAYRVAQSQRRRTRRARLEALPDDMPALTGSPSDGAQAREASRFVLQFLESLSEQKRDVFVLCVLEQLQVPEAAKILKLGVNTMYSRLRLVRAEFRKALALVAEPSEVPE